MKTKIYVGISDGKRSVFRSEFEPTFATHGGQFAAVIGPFRTKRGAEFMRDHGRANPHCQCVNDAEHLAQGESYDIARRKWIKTRAACELVGIRPEREVIPHPGDILQ